MSFMAPGFLIAAVVAACGVIALHFIVTRRPRSVAFPTARFVPDASIAAKTRSLRLSDLLLLAVRVLTILLVGAALARPELTPRREKIVRVIVADVSGSVANVAEVRDSVRALVRPGDAIVVFDTAAWTVGSVDSVVNRHGRASSGSGSLSAGLVAALRAGSRVRDGADSVELLVVSPVAALERDRATAVIRALWPGRGRLVRIASVILPDSSAQTPHIVDFLGTGRPALAVARNRIDTIGAVVARGNVVVSQFERRWRFTADSLKGARVIARWVDGDPAVIEYDSASACRTSVLVPLDSTGDMPLRPSVVSFARALSASCEPLRSVSDTALATMLVGANGHLAVAAQFPPATDVDTPLARWLVVISICLAILEMVMRRAKANAESEQ